MLLIGVYGEFVINFNGVGIKVVVFDIGYDIEYLDL